MFQRIQSLLLTAAVLLLSGAARAENNDPGSLLLFPEVDNRPGRFTILTVTNTDRGFLSENIRVHFNYIEADDCTKADALELLTPGDTVTVISAAHAPSHQRGYCYAYALGTTGGPIDFDHLTGSVIVIDGTTSSNYALNAMVFEGKPGHGLPTDVDSDGIRDFDGIEYGQLPDQIAIPRFMGQVAAPGPQPATVRAELILLNLSGGRAFSTSLNFLIFNDNEQVFSAGYGFYCWERVPLLTISGAFGRDFLLNATNDDPDEIIGLPGWEAGWCLIDGGTASSTATTISDPAFLAVLVELQRLSSTSLPFTLGRQGNGDLLPSSIFGD